MELTTGEVLTVIDSERRILYRSSSGQEVGEYVGESLGESPLLTALDGRRTMLVEIESPFDGVRRVHGLARAGETGYTIKIGVPSNALYASARRQFERYALYSIVALACAAFTTEFDEAAGRRPALTSYAHVLPPATGASRPINETCGPV